MNYSSFIIDKTRKTRLFSLSGDYNGDHKKGGTRVRVLFVEKDARGRLFFPAAQSLSR